MSKENIEKRKRGRPKKISGPLILEQKAKLNNFVANANDLCSIIKVCAQSNVRFLKLGELSLAFDGVDQPLSKSLDSAQTKPSEQDIKKISDEVEAQIMAERTATQLEMLAASDPEEWEKRIIEGDIDVGESP